MQVGRIIIIEGTTTVMVVIITIVIVVSYRNCCFFGSSMDLYSFMNIDHSNFIYGCQSLLFGVDHYKTLINLGTIKVVYF